MGDKWVLEDPNWKGENAKRLVFDNEDSARRALAFLKIYGEADWSGAFVRPVVARPDGGKP